jgi:beta-N-acetylhexosaminidase
MRRKTHLISFVVTFILLSGCIPSNPSPPANPVLPDPIKEKIKTMTLDEKIGQMVIAGIEGETPGENTNTLIKQYQIGGIILFSKNLKNANQTVQLINSLKEINSSNPIPLFISVDEEGGRVSRLPYEIKKMPTSQYIGRQNDPQLAYKVGETLGKQLKAFGFNMNFAPVLDINSNPKNPVIGDRSFGNTPDIVKEMGIREMKGMQDQQIIPVVKHFPGHGNTDTDSHIGLPVENHSLEMLHNFELIPFIEAINHNADAIMVAHILLPHIDPEYPSSMSKTIMTDLLRKELHFNGVIMTDDMTMGAILKNYDLKDAAITSIIAGTDIVLVCHQMNNVTYVLNGIKEAVEKGILSEERINESVYRILKLKEKYHLTDEKIDAVDVHALNHLVDLLFTAK